jgi:hypothetical protein
MSKNTNLSFLTDYITADITNGRIGINNASPAFAFDVTGLERSRGTTASDTAPLGSELAGVTGTGTNWALAGGATNLNVGGYTHTVGSVVPLTTSLAAVNGTYYQITYTITGRTAGSITIAYGGTSTFTTASGYIGPLASSTAVLAITPTTDFDGTVVLSIKSIGTSSASSTFANSAGTSNIEFRANSNDVNNIIIGLNAGTRAITGFSGNTYLGYNAGQNSTTAANNTYIGTQAGRFTSTGGTNTFVGSFSGYNNTIGSYNSFFGQGSGQNNTTGSSNTAIGGYNTLTSNTTGSSNTIIGTSSLQSHTTSSANNVLGSQGLLSLTSGNNNIALGYQSGRFFGGSISNALTTLDNSILIGHQAYAGGNSQTNQIVIGYQTTGLGSNTTVLGNSSTTTTAIYGNLLLGSTTDNGNKLQVTGAISASGNISGANIGGSSFSMNFGSSFNYGVGYLKSSTNGITVSTSATTIYTSTNIGGVNSGNLVLVSGVRVGNGPTFTDLILYMNSGSISVISSQIFSTPPSRNYSVSNENLTLSMASGSYIVACVALNQGYTNT